jgi:hypothetical protein
MNGRRAGIRRGAGEGLVVRAISGALVAPSGGIVAHFLLGVAPDIGGSGLGISYPIRRREVNEQPGRPIAPQRASVRQIGAPGTCGPQEGGGAEANLWAWKRKSIPLP